MRTASNIPSAWPVLWWTAAATLFADWGVDGLMSGRWAFAGVCLVLVILNGAEALAQVHRIRMAGAR